MTIHYEMVVPDPTDDDVAWNVRYYPGSPRSYWIRATRVGSLFIPEGSVVPPAEDPFDETE